MQKIVILADGSIAKTFLNDLFSAHLYEGAYEIVYYNDDTLPNTLPDFVKKHKFDPTSEYKLSQVITNDTVQVYIILQSKADTEVCIGFISSKAPAAQIIALNLWDLQKTSQTIKFIDANHTLSAQILRHIPSALPVAQNVGLGLGEIVEAQVIYGSKFAFRHISSIEQKNWRIAAVYRQNQLILPRPTLTIRPNDSLLLVGQSSVLKDIYKAFKSELGQFPQPFGNVVYLLIDSRGLTKTRFDTLLSGAKAIASKIKSSDFVIRVINPTLETEKILKSAESENIKIETEYQNAGLEEVVTNDSKKYHIGLIIVCESFFSNATVRKILTELKKPVYKIGHESVANIKKVVIALDKKPHWEAISGAFFDIAYQLGVEAKVINSEHDKSEDIIEHYQNLANLYSIKLAIEISSQNVLRYLSTKENMLHVLPLNFNTLNLSIKDIFFPEASKFLRLLNSKNQLFIPV